MSPSSEPMTSTSSSGESRPWLQEKVYGPKRERTVTLVKQAVDALVKDKKRVSLATVVAKSKELDPDESGISESAVLNNPEAKAYFDQYRSWKGSPRRNRTPVEPAVSAVSRPIKLDRDLARVRRRLMRQSKNWLVERVMTLEQGTGTEEAKWGELHDEMLTLQLRAEQAEAELAKLGKGATAFSPDEVRKLRQQIEGMQAVINAREAAVRSLQAQIADLYTKAAHGLSDQEMARSLEEEFQRTQRLQEANDDLRLRLYAKARVRMRDRARRLSK